MWWPPVLATDEICLNQARSSIDELICLLTVFARYDGWLAASSRVLEMKGQKDRKDSITVFLSFFTRQ